MFVAIDYTKIFIMLTNPYIAYLKKKTKNTLNSEIKIKELATQKPYSQ